MAESSIYSCSCTHCQNRSCNCSYCLLIKSNDDYDSSSGDESLPPPPPLSAMSLNPSNVHEEEQYTDVAIQFHRFVLLLKFFWKWNSVTKCRKTQISSHRTLLRRIVFKWRSYSEERILIFRSMITIEKLFNAHRLRTLRYVFRLMMKHSSTFQYLDQCFETWRRNVIERRDENERKLKVAYEAYILKCRTSCLQAWRIHTFLNIRQRRKEFELLRRFFCILKQSINDSKIHEKQMTEMARNYFKRMCHRRAHAQLKCWVSANWFPMCAKVYLLTKIGLLGRT